MEGVVLQATPRSVRACSSSICVALLLSACGSDDVNAPPLGASLRIISGTGVSDTVDARVQALVVEVRGRGAKLASGTVVRFEGQSISDPPSPFHDAAVSVCNVPACPGVGIAFTTDSTDANGRATVGVRLGPRVGKWVVRITVSELGLADSVSYTVTAGAPAAVHGFIADTALDIGATATVRGRIVDRYENVRTETPTLTAGPGGAVTIDAATSKVTAKDMGTQWVFLRYNSLFDSARVRVLPSGRLLVWSALEQVVRLVDINGRNERTILSSVWSELGSNPRFDPTRRRVTLHTSTSPATDDPDNIIIIDTTGASRRDVGPGLGFDGIMATRELADGTLFLVARRSADLSHPDWSLWRVATDNSITFLAYLPDVSPYNGGADISHAGTRVVFAANTATFPPELYVMDVASGSTTLIDNGFSPRWSAQDDRIVYLTAIDGSGTAVVANADGTARRSLGSATFTGGFAWSPDGIYVVGHSAGATALHIVRVDDGAQVLAFFPTATGFHDYSQLDWR